MEIPDSVRAFMVQRYAVFDSTAEVRQAVLDEFDLDIASKQVSDYNPDNKKARERLDQKWLELFVETREKFKEGLYDVGIVHKAYRLRRLDEMERALRKGNKFVEAASMLRQAAEEVGGAFEKNRGGVDLTLLKSTMDELAKAVVHEVEDPEVLRRIEERWGRMGAPEDTGSRIKEEWTW